MRGCPEGAGGEKRFVTRDVATDGCTLSRAAIDHGVRRPANTLK
ncbi:hypothetical protein MBEHAL_0311 [Halarchaeum acidiphilum MH1-52-1]|uniref:Uncharacterized protein n=1 Tax=Halarchaeum acidiphilum MH1-52-1 TaxID=1261545 RepID=U2YD27_9EURY|nr:hypothetical protein MBEHAL_0311 [Halarchaeum acidiphilum MH1-52-1]